ncbi:MAG: PAS domain-containing protein [Deltaproteobacteria bacterium]|nr:PAS domain-containing protein [Deltaproteobacteria bacterium]
MIAKTKKQVRLLILVPLVLSLIVAASFFWMKRAVGDAVQLHQAAEEVEKSVLGLNQVISQYLLHPGERPQVQFGLVYGRLTKSLSRLQPETDRERQMVAKMRWEWETIGELFPLLTGWEGGPEAGRVGPETSEQRERVIGQLLISSEEIWQNSFQLVKLGSGRMADHVNETMAFSMAAVLFSGAIIVVLAFFIGRGIVGTQKNLEREIAERRQAEEALQKARDHLEVRVAERTRQLSEEIEERKRTEESLREAQEELRLLSSKILSAQENERRKIAGELHDHIWQILNRVLLESSQFINWTGADDPAAVRRAAGIIQEDVRAAIVKIRSLQGELWPPVLDDLGILATINWYLREFAREQTALELEKQIEVSEEEVPPDLRIVIYRVLQESLNNVARHSGAGRVRVSLKKDQERIEFEVEDDGRGFDLKQILFGSSTWLGFGLVGIKEKVEQSGGFLDVASQPGVGTILRASWHSDESRRKTTPRISDDRGRKEWEGRFRDVTQALSDWVYSTRVEADGRFVPDWVTPGFTEVTGYTFEDLHDKPDLYWNLFPEDRSLGEIRWRTIQAAEPYRGEFRVVTKSGEVLWVRDYCNPVADPFRPGTIRVIGAAHDITERKGAENLLQAQRDLLLAAAEMRTVPEMLQRCLAAAVSVSGMDSGGLYLADAAGGLHLAESIGLPEDFVAAVRTYPAEATQTRLVMAGKAVYSRLADLNLPPPVPESGRLPALRALAILPLRQGTEIVGCLNMASHTLDEVSGPGRAALETIASTIGLLLGRMRAEEALRKNEERLSRVVRAGRIGLYEWNLAQKNAYWSPEAYELFGREPGAATDFEGWLACVHPDDRERVQDQATTLLEQVRRSKDRVSQQDEYRVVHGNGTMLWLQATTVFDLEGGNLVLRGVVRDVTEHKAAEETLAQLASFPEENPNPVLRVSVNGRVLYANRPAGSWLTNGWGWQTDTPLPEPLGALLGKASSPGQVVEEDITCRLGRSFLMTAVRPPNVDYVTIYGRDITFRKRVENEIQRHLEELRIKNEELQRFNRVAVDRELRMIELKKQVNELCALTGQPQRYKIEFDAINQ